jgi:5-hydroxyisourate hydrolase-like protein (transthyretin family)
VRENDFLISTQVIDTAKGIPAQRIPVELDYFITGQGWREVGHSVTSREGRIPEFGEPPAGGLYRMMFDVGAYMPHCFFPSVTVMLEVQDPSEDHQIILQVSPFSYSVTRVG